MEELLVRRAAVVSRQMVMSAATEPAVIASTKTVTRRLGWNHTKVGDTLTLVRKMMKGTGSSFWLDPLAEVEVVSIHSEMLCMVLDGDMADEGYPSMTASDYVTAFCRRHRADPWSPVKVIRWRYLRVLCTECRNRFDGKVPGHSYGSNWDWVDCRTCRGTGWEPEVSA